MYVCLKQRLGKQHTSVCKQTDKTHTHTHQKKKETGRTHDWSVECVICQRFLLTAIIQRRSAGDHHLDHSTQMTANNLTVLWGRVHSGNFLFLSLSSSTAEIFHSSAVHSPDEPPALQVLLDDLHGDPFIKADFVLPLTGVRLYGDIFFLWI